MIINIGHPRDSHELEKALSATLGAVFAHVVARPDPPLNSLVIASDSPAQPSEAVREAPLPAICRPLAAQSAGRIENALRGGTVFTDDRAPVEWLIDASIVSYAAGETRMSAAAAERAPARGLGVRRGRRLRRRDLDARAPRSPPRG